MRSTPLLCLLLATPTLWAQTPASPAAPTVAPAQVPAEAPKPRTEDRVELEATQITGNSELPRVMYVVPWKRAMAGDLSGRPARSLLDQVLEPVDREVFVRQTRYYQALRQAPASPAAAPPKSP